MEHWRSFTHGNWNNCIDVRDFIKLNYTLYRGDESFLSEPTKRTKSVLSKAEALFAEETKKGGVLDVDCDTVSSILAYKPGYISEGEDIILGLQTDKPLKRAVNAGTYEINPDQFAQKLFEKYNSTHLGSF